MRTSKQHYYREFLPNTVPSRFPSIAVPVSLIDGTVGLRSGEMLGIFAEHFGFGMAQQQFWPTARANYLTDRFQQRYNDVSSRCIEVMTTHDSLAVLKSWSPPLDDERSIKLAASWWLSLHEHFHGIGKLPFHKFMSKKRNRLAAGFEELRVDLLAMLQLMELDIPNGRAIAEYVFAKRALTYPVIDLRNPGRVKMTFDSVGSHLFCLRLLDLGALEIVNGKLRVLQHWPVAVREIAKEFADLESWIVTLPAVERRDALLGFVRKTTQECSSETPRVHRSGDQVPMLEFFFRCHERVS